MTAIANRDKPSDNAPRWRNAPLPTKFVDKIGMPQVMNFVTEKLARFDTSLVEWIKLLPLNRRVVLHGECAYPVRAAPGASTCRSGYRLRASVNVELPPPYTHQHWARIPSREHRQGWHSGPALFEFATLDECAVHTLAHECFHFLSHSKQTAMKNTEANANWWADQWLAEYLREHAHR